MKIKTTTPGIGENRKPRKSKIKVSKLLDELVSRGIRMLENVLYSQCGRNVYRLQNLTGGRLRTMRSTDTLGAIVSPCVFVPVKKRRRVIPTGR